MPALPRQPPSPLPLEHPRVLRVDIPFLELSRTLCTLRTGVPPAVRHREQGAIQAVRRAAQRRASQHDAHGGCTVRPRGDPPTTQCHTHHNIFKRLLCFPFIHLLMDPYSHGADR